MDRESVAVGVKFEEEDLGWVFLRDQHFKLKGSGFLFQAASSMRKEGAENFFSCIRLKLDGDDEGPLCS
jgi:hypothetical protein